MSEITLISIHALREEGDASVTILAITIVVFQSTPSARRATTTTGSPAFRWIYFNPRPPRGGRLGDSADAMSILDFNPRPPRGGRLVVLKNDDLAGGDFNPRPPRGGRHLYF